MQLWQIDAPVRPALVKGTSVEVLIGAIGSRDDSAFAAAVLEAVHRSVPIVNAAIYRIGAAAPALLGYAATGSPSVPSLLGNAYVRGLYRRDPVQHALQALPRSAAGDPLLLARQASDEIADDEYRRVCYASVNHVDRLSIVSPAGSGERLIVSLYRHRAHGAFAPADIDQVRALAPIIASALARHLAWGPRGAGGIAARAGSRLDRLCPSLSRREREVLIRMAAGLSNDGIAADLDIKPTSVVTYRNRAFARLGIHSRRELFARLLD